MDAVKFLEEYNRMCNTYNDCVGCPMQLKPFCHPHDMTTNSELKNLVIAVERWSCEHSMVANDTSDTVSRAAAIDAIDRAATKEAARWSLQELPSAQPEIIKCKECKHWLDIDDGRQKHRMCADICGDWFCADAERRTDDER